VEKVKSIKYTVYLLPAIYSSFKLNYQFVKITYKYIV
jgi:hypothetical protein